MTYNAYKGSVAAKKIHKNHYVGIIDIDGTFVFGKPKATETWQRELEARRKVRALIEERGVLASITMRTPATMLTDASYRKAVLRGFSEPRPHLGKGPDNKHFWQAPDTLEEFSHVLDWDIIGGVGMGILVKGEGEYSIDDEYVNYIGVPSTWRQSILDLVRSIDQEEEIVQFLSPIEYDGRYSQGDVDVAPLPYRVQFNFEGKRGLYLRRMLIDRILHVRQHGDSKLKAVASKIVFLDESIPIDEKYTVYLLPLHGTKERMLDHMVKGISNASGILTRDMRMLFAGDTMTDLRAGLYGGMDAELTFILVGGSRIVPYILGDMKGKDFAGESLEWFSNRLRKTGHPGIYYFNVPSRGRRVVVMGDYAFPGTRGPETIAAWLESESKTEE